jgi:hypothetical protein
MFYNYYFNLQWCPYVWLVLTGQQARPQLRSAPLVQLVMPALLVRIRKYAHARIRLGRTRVTELSSKCICMYEAIAIAIATDHEA